MSPRHDTLHLNTRPGAARRGLWAWVVTAMFGLTLGSAARLSAADIPIPDGEPAATVRTIPASPAELWKVEANPGDNVAVTTAGDVIGIAYEVNVQDRDPQKQGVFRLLLKKPVVMRDDEAHILFESAGQGRATVLRPLIQDAAGELFIYEQHPCDALEAKAQPPGKLVKTAKWTSWRSNGLQVTEAGGVPHCGMANGVYEVQGPGNSFPDGKLTFLGFEARISMGNNLKIQETLMLGNIGTTGVQLPQGDPFFYAGALMTEKGHYRVAMDIRDRFQGKTFYESTSEIDFDPENPQSCRQKITFPVGAVKNSWIGCRVTDSAGKTVSSGAYRWEKNLPHTAKAPPADYSKKAPSIGLMRINPDSHTEGVYQPGENADIAVRVFSAPEIAGTTALKWELFPHRKYTNSLGKGELNVTVKAPFSDTVIKAPVTPDRNAYLLKLALFRDGKEIDTQEYVFGFAKIAAYNSRTGKIFDRDYYKRSSYMHTTFFGGGATEDDHFKLFCKMLDESASLAQIVTYGVDFADLEILPGVFDFTVLDRVMDEAYDRARKLTVRLSHTESSPYRWLNYTRPRCFDGAPIRDPQNYYGAFDETDPEFVSAIFRSYKAIYDRYGKHPAFQGYQLWLPSGEHTPDKPWQGEVSGYSWSSAEAFREYLKGQYEGSLEKLNAQWSSKYTDWKQIDPPQPTWSKAKEPDLSPAWIDFSRFKMHLFSSWYPKTADYIRGFDANHVIIAYAAQNVKGEADEALFGKVDYFHNGGNHFEQDENALVEAWDKGIGWITEPHQPFMWASYGDPAEKGWVLDWSVYVMTAQAGGGGANLHVYYGPDVNGRVAHYGGAHAYDRLEKYKPILDELHGLKLLQSQKQVAVLQDELSLLAKHRTTFGARLKDLARWFELLKADSIDYEWMRSSNLKNYKLLVLNPIDEVLSRDNIETVDRLVRDGAYAIVNARTGRVCPDMPGQDYALLQKLGLPAPAGTYVPDQPAVKAKVSGENPFFKDGSEIQFVSQSDIAREVQDGVKDLWQWPYRWIPYSDYFGYYKDNKLDQGQIIARFPDGGAALSLHEVGKGKVLVMWGTPDMKPSLLKGFMANAAKWASAVNPRAGSAIPRMIEGDHKELKRHYALLFNETPGEYVQKIPGAPDGRWFIDEMVSDQKMGVYTGEELRKDGIKLVYLEGFSPLKILRMIPEDRLGQNRAWHTKYRQPEK